MDLLELIRLGGFAGVDLRMDSLVRICRCGLEWICLNGFAKEDSWEASPEWIDGSGFTGMDLPAWICWSGFAGMDSPEWICLGGLTGADFLEPIGWRGFAGVDLPRKIHR